MNGDLAVQALIDAMEAERVSYMLTGSLASNVYGVARSTKDADVVFDFSGEKLNLVMARLGPDFRLQEQITFETLTGSTRHILDIRGTAFQIELFRLNPDPHMTERFKRRRQMAYPSWNRKVWLPTAEDVIIQKVRWARSKDLDDARDVLAVQGDALDFAYIRHWCGLHDTLEKLDELLGSIPEGI